MKVIIEIDGEENVLDLPESVVSTLREIADRNGLTLEAALQSAIQNENTFEELAAKGDLLVRRGDELRQLELA